MKHGRAKIYPITFSIWLFVLIESKQKLSKTLLGLEIIKNFINSRCKVRPSYDQSCAIFSSFNFMVIFNVMSADSTLKMTIERTEDRANRIITMFIILQGLSFDGKALLC